MNIIYSNPEPYFECEACQRPTHYCESCKDLFCKTHILDHISINRNHRPCILTIQLDEQGYMDSLSNGINRFYINLDTTTQKILSNSRSIIDSVNGITKEIIKSLHDLREAYSKAFEKFKETGLAADFNKIIICDLIEVSDIEVQNFQRLIVESFGSYISKINEAITKLLDDRINIEIINDDYKEEKNFPDDLYHTYGGELSLYSKETQIIENTEIYMIATCYIDNKYLYNVYNQLYSFDPTTKTKTKLKELKFSHESRACVCKLNLIYFFGGRGRTHRKSKIESEKYNYTTKKLNRISNLPLPSRSNMASLIYDRIFIVGKEIPYVLEYLDEIDRYIYHFDILDGGNHFKIICGSWVLIDDDSKIYEITPQSAKKIETGKKITFSCNMAYVFHRQEFYYFFDSNCLYKFDPRIKRLSSWLLNKSV
jgi:hypothetical protein